MAAEYLANAVQSVALNAPIIFSASIPCRRGYIYHEDETGIFTLRGVTNQCFATYRVTFNGNVQLPEGATVTPIALAIAVQGEERPTSKAIYTPAAVQELGNLTSTCIVKVPRGCCFSLAVEAVPATTDPTVTPAPIIEVQNANLVIDRIA
jgi:hypothetical protein